MTNPSTLMSLADETGSGRDPAETGSREPSPAVSAASGFDPSRIWSEDLTDAQLSMVMESGGDDRGPGDGVELRGARWTVARALVRKGLGWIEGGAPNGSELPSLYFNGEEGARIAHEFDEDE